MKANIGDTIEYVLDSVGGVWRTFTYIGDIIDVRGLIFKRYLVRDTGNRISLIKKKQIIEILKRG